MPAEIATLPVLTMNDFLKLPAESREAALMKYQALEEMGRLLNEMPIRKAASRVAALYQGHRGFAASTLVTTWYAFLKNPTLETLVNGSKAKKGATCLPPEFVEYWKGLQNVYQREHCIRVARRELIRRWKTGMDIPGYGAWTNWWLNTRPNLPLPESCPGEPCGWSYNNLKNYRPNKVESDLIKQGTSKAVTRCLDVERTRVGVRPLEYVFFDDAQTDFWVVAGGQPSKLLCLFGIDLASAKFLGFGSRPGLRRTKEEIAKGLGKTVGLNERDMKVLVVNLLRRFGYPKNYIMHLVLENGTASLPPAFIKALEFVTGGQVTGKYTEMLGREILTGFPEKGKGNPRGKTQIESSFNLLWNEACHVKGQKGSRYDRQPAHFDAMKKRAMEMLEVNQYLPAEIRQALADHFPFKNFGEANVTIEDIIRRVDTRTDHVLEGFQTVSEWRPLGTSKWRPWSDLMNHGMHDVEFRERQEAPVERWLRLCEDAEVEFVKLPDEAVSYLLEGHHRVVKVEKQAIKFRYQKEVYRFSDWVGASPTPETICTPDNEGKQFLAFYDELDMTKLFLNNMDGSFAGTVPILRRATWGDVEATTKQYEAKQRALKEAERRIKTRGVKRTQAEVEKLDQHLSTLNEAEAILISGEADPAPSEPFSEVNNAIQAHREEIERRETELQDAENADMLKYLGAQIDQAKENDSL